MFYFILLQCLLINLVQSLSEHPILLVISYDAFRYNFLNNKVTPNMLKLREQGTYAEYMYNVFPTKTFPNHHSIATGLYPETHGVIGNSFYDNESQQVIGLGYKLFHYDESIIPIWRLNEMSERGRYSGIMMWPGAGYKYQGKFPTYLQDFDPGLSWHKRVDTVLSWIENKKKPANLIMMYFEEPDTHGHVFGPNSNVVHQFLQQLDNITLYLQDQVEQKGLTGKVNIIYLSDHGMVSSKLPNCIDLTKILPDDMYHIAGSSPSLHIIPNEGLEEDIYNLLLNASNSIGHFKVYKKEELLSRWKFKNNHRTPPLFLLADEGYAFQDIISNAKQYSKKYHFQLTNNSEFGIHGYDNRLSSMHPFFMAVGPQIKINHKVSPFNIVDLFSLFCAILKLKPTAHQGLYNNIEDILVGYHGSLLPIVVIIVGGVLLALLLILCAAVITLLIIKRQQNITTAAALNKRFPQNFSHSNIEAQHLLEPEDA